MAHVILLVYWAHSNHRRFSTIQKQSGFKISSAQKLCMVPCVPHIRAHSVLFSMLKEIHTMTRSSGKILEAQSILKWYRKDPSQRRFQNSAFQNFFIFPPSIHDTSRYHWDHWDCGSWWWWPRLWLRTSTPSPSRPKIQGKNIMIEMFTKKKNERI